MSTTMVKEKIADKFIALLRDSTIVQGGITFVCIVTACYLWMNGKEVPETLLGIVLLVVGYYFGSKTQQRINKKESIDAS